MKYNNKITRPIIYAENKRFNRRKRFRMIRKKHQSNFEKSVPSH